MLKLSGLALLMCSSFNLIAANYCASEVIGGNLSLLRDVASSSAANLSDPTKDKFCTDRSDRNKIAEILRNKENLLSYGNGGGLFNITNGVCWWHSRLQRRMAYLANYRPDLPKPSDSAVKKILRQIKRGKSVVTIPGYKNLEEFSTEHFDKIQKSLNAWIFGDTFVRQQWIKGLKGKATLSPKKMKSHVEKMYADYQKADGPLVQVLQMPGVNAHAWVLNDMKKVSDKEYEIEVIDSNFSQQVMRYSIFTDSSNMLPITAMKNSTKGAEDEYAINIFNNYEEFNAYTQWGGELSKLKKAVSKYCGNEVASVEIEDGEEDEVLDKNDDNQDEL